jgi:hypothetical protein
MPNSSLSYRFGATRTRTRVLKLAVGRVPDGGTVTVLCRGGKRRGCTFARRGVKVSAGGDAKAIALVRPLRLRAGAVLEVRVAAPGLATKVSRFTIRKPPRGPLLRSGCLKPGASKLATCA